MEVVDPFWGDINVLETLLGYRFEENSISHSALCFKKDCECRFLFPFMSTKCTCIHEDRGVKDQNQNKTLWYFLDILVNNVYSFIVLPKQPMSCQFMIGAALENFLAQKQKKNDSTYARKIK